MSASLINGKTLQRHMDRYIRFRGGMTKEEIAESDNVALKTVEQSINVVQAYRNYCTMTEMDTCLFDIVISKGEKLRKALDEGLDATKIVKDDNGKDLVVPDHDARTRWADVMVKVVTAAKPKKEGMFPVNVNVNQQQATVVTPAEGKGGESFEEVLMRVRAKTAHPQLEAPSDASEGVTIDGQT
jgi:hypothetical protein